CRRTSDDAPHSRVSINCCEITRCTYWDARKLPVGNEFLGKIGIQLDKPADPSMSFKFQNGLDAVERNVDNIATTAAGISFWRAACITKLPFSPSMTPCSGMLHMGSALPLQHHHRPTSPLQ
ncbi:hypothetical protein HDU84_000551, partial [Entophlyctis sp. JEL0112]